MTFHRRYLAWGVFLICLGIVPLGVQLGWIDARTAASILRLWPLILVGIGLSLVLRMTRYRVLGGVLSAAVMGLVIGVFFAGGLASAAFVCAGADPTGAPHTRAGSFATQAGSFAGPTANVNIELTCGEMTLARSGEQAWSVSVATDDGAPIVLADADSLDLRSADARFVGPFPGGSNERWDVSLPSSTTIAAGVTLNAASGELAFGNGALSHVSATFNGADSLLDLRGAAADSSVSATLNASSVRLMLPESAVQASLTLNVASLTVCVAPTSALLIHYSNTLGSDNFAAAGLQGGGESWATPGIVPAASELHITSNLSTIRLDRSGECQ